MRLAATFGWSPTQRARLVGALFVCGLQAVACVAVVGLVACDSAADGSGDDDVEGLGDPCSSDGTLGDLCLGTLVCVEPNAGRGGACAVGPDDCAAVDNDDFCACDLSSLCDGAAPDQCFVVEGRRGIACTAAP